MSSCRWYELAKSLTYPSPVRLLSLSYLSSPLTFYERQRDYSSNFLGIRIYYDPFSQDVPISACDKRQLLAFLRGLSTFLGQVLI